MIQLFVSFIKGMFFVPVAYAQGLWFLLIHPIQFVKFMGLYNKHKQGIDNQSKIAETGYYDMSRADRRAVLRKAQKEASKQFMGRA